MESMSKAVLIDGLSILNRAFYGVPDLTNSEGTHTNAVYGFLNIMFKILDEEKPEYMAVAFDLSAPTFRHKMFSDYKGTRKGMPDELRQQVPIIKEVLKAMNVKTLEKEGYEADDIIGTMSRCLDKEGVLVSVISGDRDLLQLATDTIKIRIPKTKATGTEVEDYYAADVLARYGVTPTEFIDLKALMGDSSDNIPGVPGIGEKTAAKIIMEYKNIECAHKHASEIKPKKASENMIAFWEQAQLSKVLATICTSCPIDYSLDEMLLGELYTQDAYIILKKLEFKNILSRFAMDSAPKTESIPVAKHVDMDSFIGILEKCNDLDCVGLYYHLENPKGVGVYLDGISYFIEESFVPTLSMLYQNILSRSRCVSFGNLKDCIDVFGIDSKDSVFDASVAAYLLNPLKDSYLYDDIARDYLGLTLPSENDIFGKKKHQDIFVETPEMFLKYISWNVACAALAKQNIVDQLSDEEMLDLYNQIELPLIFVLKSMENYGIKVEKDSLKTYGDALMDRISVLEKNIYELAGEKFNINSPKQLGTILFEKLRLPYGKKTKTGYSTSAEVLEKLRSEDPIVNMILEYRQLTKLKSTYADGLYAYIGDDGRIHGKFNQTITATGRISSTEPNLQNIPIRMELGRLIRKVFVPEDNYVFVDADYSQIELRVLAHMSEDDQLIQAYKEAQDIHRSTASKVFGIPMEEVTDLQRRNAKAVNFGIVYGISSFGLSQDLSISRKEAADYIEQYFQTYPGIKTFLDNSVESAKTLGYSKTMYGRRRPLPEIKSSNFMQRSFGERIAMNAPIQGTAADIIKIAMIRVKERLETLNLRSRLILQVHDELLIETHKDEIKQVCSLLKEEMEQAAQLSVPLDVDVHSGTNWYEAK